MKLILNNLYIFSKNKYLHKDHETIEIVEKSEDGTSSVVAYFPVHTISGIYIYNSSIVSTWLISFCSEHGINLSYFTEQGRFLGRLVGPIHGNVLLRKKQFTLSSDEKFVLAKNQVVSKLKSSLNLLNRFSRNHGIDLAENIQTIKRNIKFVISDISKSTNVLMGFEGAGAKAYFDCFSKMLLNNDFSYTERTRRPPKNYIDAMLSYLYAVAEADITSAISAIGLDPQEGFLHADRSGRASLSLDILEEFRAYLVDRTVLSMVNRKEINIKDFNKDCLDGISMNENVRKYIVSVYQKRKSDVVFHEYLKQKVPVGLLFNIQAALYAQYLRGDLEFYPPFYFR